MLLPVQVIPSPMPLISVKALENNWSGGKKYISKNE
jgi:hypothetical protein